MSTQETYLTDIANAIREKTGSSAKIVATDFAKTIRAIPTSYSGSGIPPEFNTLVYCKQVDDVDLSGTATITFACLSTEFPYIIIATSEDQVYPLALICYDSSTDKYNGQFFSSSNTGYKKGVATYSKTSSSSSRVTYTITWMINPTADQSIITRGINVYIYTWTKS